jgi:hypothetical protein
MSLFVIYFKVRLLLRSCYNLSCGQKHTGIKAQIHTKASKDAPEWVVCIVFARKAKKVPSPRGGKPFSFLQGRQKEEAMISTPTKFRNGSKLLLLSVCLYLVIILAITGCIKVVPSETPDYKPESTEPTSSSAQESASEAAAPTNTVEALVVPTEGRIGEYITVKVRVVENSICVLSLSQSIEGTTSIVNYKLGQAYPDDDLVVTWYSQIPLNLKPGSYLLRIEQIPLGQVAGDYILSQSFIVK